jgi:hypothetical protein
VNVFALNDYQQALSWGHVRGDVPLSRRDQMRYRFMTDLYGLRMVRAALRSVSACRCRAGCGK